MDYVQGGPRDPLPAHTTRSKSVTVPLPETVQLPLKRKPGRPKGSKDSYPRARYGTKGKSEAKDDVVPAPYASASTMPRVTLDALRIFKEGIHLVGHSVCSVYSTPNSYRLFRTLKFAPSVLLAVGLGIVLQVRPPRDAFTVKGATNIALWLSRRWIITRTQIIYLISVLLAPPVSSFSLLFSFLGD